jgi:urease accessory protein
MDVNASPQGSKADAVAEAQPPALPASVRVSTRLRLAVGGDARATILDRREEGAYRFRMPHMAEPAARQRQLEALIVNVAGGLAGGDRVGIDASSEAEKSLLISSATAERIYRSDVETTTFDITLAARSGGRLVWLPQETVLHEGARLTRRIEADAEAGATLLFGEITHLGRRASREAFRHGLIRERWRFRQAGRLVFADETRLDAQALGERLEGPAFLADGTTIATLILLADDASERLEPIRRALALVPGVTAGASARDGLVFARVIGKDGAACRRAFLAAVQAAAGRTVPLPRLIAAECQDFDVP